MSKVNQSKNNIDMSQPNCHAVPEFMFFLIWLRRPYPSKVGLGISKLPYYTLP